MITREELGLKITETTQVMADGYRLAISQFQTEAEQDSNEKCAIAVSNAGYFILQSLGFSHEEIKALFEGYRNRDAA